MRSIWNGAISFGLVSIPVKLMNATENRSISFRQIHLEDDGRIRYRKFCELEDREVAQAEIGKGYQDADGTIIPVTDEDLAKLPLPTARTIEILAFVPEDRIDPLQLDNAYYLSANGLPATKPYALLREALRRSGKVAVAKYALRGRERLGMLRAAEEVITMHGLLWPDEIRAPEGVAPDRKVTVRDKELDLADALMDTLGDVDLDDLHDDYRTALEELITAKAEGKHLEPVAEPEGGKVLDLMAALEKSVQAAQQSRGAGGEETAGEAAVRRLPERTSAGTAPKEVGGKKSTSTAKKATGRTTPGKAATTGKATSGSTGTPKSPAKKTAAKKTADKSTPTTRKPASTTAAKTTKTTKATGEKTTAKKSATKKSTAKKPTASKRTA